MMGEIMGLARNKLGYFYFNRCCLGGQGCDFGFCTLGS